MLMNMAHATPVRSDDGSTGLPLEAPLCRAYENPGGVLVGPGHRDYRLPLDPCQQHRRCWLRPVRLSAGATIGIVMLASGLVPTCGVVGAVSDGHPRAADPGVPDDRTSSGALTVEPQLLELTGPAAHSFAEISGMAWKGDSLIVLPQYPTRFADSGELGFFILTRSEILAALDGHTKGPITPQQVTCRAPGLSRIVRGFDGLEALGLLGNRCYLTVEAAEDTMMAGYLVSGRYDAVQGEIIIDMERLTAIPLGLNIPNIAEEALLIAGDEIITMSEANGRNVNPQPVAKRFSPDLEFLGTLPLPQIEFRVTDATSIDDEGRFWVINYLYPPDRAILDPSTDPEPPADPAAEWDPDACIERLLELRLVRGGPSGDHIERTATPPIYLTLQSDGKCRNWEAIARLDDRGFLLMTDKYPTTLLAFVPYEF